MQRLSSSEMLRGRSDADTSSNLKPRFCFRGEAFLKEKRKEIEWVGGRDGDSEWDFDMNSSSCLFIDR